jgi:RsiW-degrading membrane proteinase PrsW (M82 family)
MTGWAVLIAFLLAPLACWALLARTKVLGWAFASVFAAYAVTEGVLMAGGWPLRYEPIWVLAGLPLLTLIALVTGTCLEEHEIKLGVPGLGSRVRFATGVLLALVYSAVVLGTAVLVIGAAGAPHQ